MCLPDHVHGSSPRLKEVGGVLDAAHVAQDALPHRLQKSAEVQTRTKGRGLGPDGGRSTLICSAKRPSSSVSSTAALLPELKYCAAKIIFPSSNWRFLTSSCRGHGEVMKNGANRRLSPRRQTWSIVSKSRCWSAWVT